MKAIATEIMQENYIQGIQIGKEEINIFILDYMILYIENSKEYTKELLDSITMFSKISEYNINIEKKSWHFYVSAIE